MNFVIDTSVIIAVIANEPEKPAIIARTQGAELFAPRSLHWEIGNAFSAMLKRGRITLEQAKAAVAIYEEISLNLAESQNCPLLTLDGGLSYAAKAAGVNVEEVNLTDADLP